MKNEKAGIPREILQKLASTRIAGEAMMVLMLLLDETYGKGRSKAFIKNRACEESTGLLPSVFIRARKRLEDMNIIKVKKTNLGALYEFYESSKWNCFEKIKEKKQNNLKKPATVSKIANGISKIANGISKIANTPKKDNHKNDTKINKIVESKKAVELTKLITLLAKLLILRNSQNNYSYDYSDKQDLNAKNFVSNKVLSNVKIVNYKDLKQGSALALPYTTEKNSVVHKQQKKIVEQDVLVLTGESIKKPIKAKKSLKEHSNGGHRLLGYWCDCFYERVGFEYMPVYKRDIPCMNRLFNNYGEEKGKQIIDVFYKMEKDERSWQNGKLSVLVLLSSLPEILVKLAEMKKENKKFEKSQKTAEKNAVRVPAAAEPPFEKMKEELKKEYGETGWMLGVSDYCAKWREKIAEVSRILNNICEVKNVSRSYK